MKLKNITIGKYYRLKDTPNYSYIKPLEILPPKTKENKNTYTVIKCEHTVNKNDTFGFIRYFKLSEIIEE